MAETPLLPFIRSIFSINAPLEKGGEGGVFLAALCKQVNIFGNALSKASMYGTSTFLSQLLLRKMCIHYFF
jgi:hypothetical protein